MPPFFISPEIQNSRSLFGTQRTASVQTGIPRSYPTLWISSVKKTPFSYAPLRRQFWPLIFQTVDFDLERIPRRKQKNPRKISDFSFILRGFHFVWQLPIFALRLLSAFCSLTGQVRYVSGCILQAIVTVLRFF